MNKAELVAAVAGHTGTDPKVVALVLNGTEDVIVAKVKQGQEKVVWTGFLSFDQVARKARMGRNPATGESIRVKAKKAPRVSTGAAFKKVIAGEVPVPRITVAKAAGRPAQKAAAPVKRAAPTRSTAAAPAKKATAAKRTPVSAGTKARAANGKRAAAAKTPAKATGRRATKS